MKLTNYIRDAFVERAMQDVPTGKDYENIITDAVRAIFVNRLPPAVSKVWKDSKTQGFVRVSSFRGFGISVAVPFDHERWGAISENELTEDERKPLKALEKDWEAERVQRAELRSKLRAAAYGCTTRKALAELLPEFAQYLPPEDAPAGRSLPVVANLVTDFVKAGWPKNKKPKAAA